MICDQGRANEEVAMKHKITVKVPIEKRGFLGKKKTVFEERTIIVDGPTYRKIKQAQEDAELEDFLDFMEEMDLIEDLMND